MTTQQQSILFALEQLRRSAWPDVPPDFGQAPHTDPSTLMDPSHIRSLSDVSIRAERWTCRLSPESIRNHIDHHQTGPIIIHAVDADLAVPLLAYWTMRHRDCLTRLADHLRNVARAEVQLVLPNDLPGAWRREFKNARGIEWIEPKYPSGHWRMLPHILGNNRRSPLVLDAVAGVDLAFALNGDTSPDRPIAICDLDRSEPVSFKIVSRESRVAQFLSPDLNTRWLAGPRWRRRPAGDDQTIGDGELVFHADRDPPRSQSPCIRCGWCEYICPTRCSPVEFLRAQREHDLARARRAGLGSCIDCGLCTNVCPSNLPLNLFIDRLRHATPEVR